MEDDKDEYEGIYNEFLEAFKRLSAPVQQQRRCLICGGFIHPKEQAEGKRTHERCDIRFERRRRR